MPHARWRMNEVERRNEVVNFIISALPFPIDREDKANLTKSIATTDQMTKGLINEPSRIPNRRTERSLTWKRMA